MRRGDLRFYAVVAALTIIIFFVLRGTKKKEDFRQIAKDKLQLTSELRPTSCKSITKQEKSLLTGKVSIIVSTQANDEAIITQTVNSIIAHTDPSVLEEIIIAADSHMTDEKKKLMVQEFGKYHSLVTIMHGNSEERLKNKLVVGHTAKGNIVIFIDDTVVVTSNYLPPLLEVLHEHPEGIAVPSFEYLTDLTVSAEKSWSQMAWIFGWKLDIQAYELSFQELASKPENKALNAIVFDSSSFAIHKTYLEKLGTIKHNMAYTSSIELSFTTWLCGDGAFVAPCSRVAKVNSENSISIKDDRTKQLIAQRYFTDKYLRIFKRVNKEPIDLSSDEALVRIEKNFQKKCPRNFDWYMENVAKKEVFVPSADAVAYGYFDSNSGKVCFRQTPAMIFLGYFGCKMHSRGKMVEYLKSGQLRIGSECITGSDKSYMVTDPCDYDKKEFKWSTTRYKQFKDSQNRCISHATDPYPEENERQVLMFTDCTDESKPNSLKWQTWNSFIWLD